MGKVTAADVNDRPGLGSLLAPLTHKFNMLKKLWMDMGYQSKHLKELASSYGIDIEVVKRPSSRFWFPNDVKNVEEYLNHVVLKYLLGSKCYQDVGLSRGHLLGLGGIGV